MHLLYLLYLQDLAGDCCHSPAAGCWARRSRWQPESGWPRRRGRLQPRHPRTRRLHDAFCLRCLCRSRKSDQTVDMMMRRQTHPRVRGRMKRTDQVRKTAKVLDHFMLMKSSHQWQPWRHRQLKGKETRILWQLARGSGNQGVRWRQWGKNCLYLLCESNLMT